MPYIETRKHEKRPGFWIPGAFVVGTVHICNKAVAKRGDISLTPPPGKGRISSRTEFLRRFALFLIGSKYAASTEKIWLPALTQIFGIDTSGGGTQIGANKYYAYPPSITTLTGLESQNVLTLFGENQWEFFQDMTTYDQVIPYFVPYYNAPRGYGMSRTPSRLAVNAVWDISDTGYVHTFQTTFELGITPAFTMSLN